MRRLTRHLAGHVLAFAAIVALVLVAIYTFISFVSDIDQTGQGGFGIAQLAYYSLMMMPTGLYLLMPVVALLGTLVGLGALAAQNEITAMRAAGLTVTQIGRAVLLAGLLLGGLQVALGDWLVPVGTQAARTLRSEARTSGEVGLATRPIWLRDGTAVVHIGNLKSESRIGDVEIYELAEDLSLLSVLHAADGEFVDDRWQLREITRTRFEDGRVTADKLERDEYLGSLSPEVLRLFVLEADSLTTAGLRRLIHYLDSNGLDTRSYQLTLWRKLIAPLTVMVMMLFAVPFILGSQRGGGAGQRLLIGVLVGLVFYVVNEVTASVGQLFGWPPVLAAGLPTFALALLALQRLRRAR